MNASAASVPRFVLRILLWLPPCFAAWYFTAPFHAAIVGGLSRLWVGAFAPGLVTALERSGSTLAFVTTLQVQAAPGQMGLLVPEVGPLVYTYGTALFVALMLAARGKMWKIVLGAAVLLPFQAWGVAFDLLVQVGVRLGPEVAAQAGLTGWRREGIALGYQLGSVILPSLVPVVAWAFLCREFIEGLLRTQAAEPERVLPRELRPEEKDLGRVIDP